MSDDISETVQDRDIITVKDYQQIKRGLSNGTNTDDLE